MPIYADFSQESVELACPDRKEEGRDRIAALIAARRPAFLANRLLDLGKMQDALASRDFAAIQNIGHNCKGTGTGYGFPDISRIGATIEIAARALDGIELEKLIQQFAGCIQTSCFDQPG
jgi:hypothetical protein